MDWDNPYITMDPKQEADTVRAFADCVERGYVSRKIKQYRGVLHAKQYLQQQR